MILATCLLSISALAIIWAIVWDRREQIKEDNYLKNLSPEQRRRVELFVEYGVASQQEADLLDEAIARGDIK